MQGKFIVIEGQGFTGKTTQTKLLAQKLKEKGIKAIDTREPGGVPEAEKIREDLLNKRAQNVFTVEDEVKLFYAAREAFLKELVRPALEEGIWVVSSRFSPSTLVYQGIVEGYDLELIKKLDKEIVGDTKPDLIILLDLPDHQVIKRMVEDTRIAHSYNEFNEDIIKKRRKGYLKLAMEGDNWEVVDGTGTVDKVSEKIWDLVSKKFSL